MQWFRFGPERLRPGRAAARRGALLLALVALAGATKGSAGATALPRTMLAHRVLAGQSTTRVLTLVYKGSGTGRIVQHVDNRPGHGGAAYGDIYTKQVHWTIRWQTTIEDGQISAVSDPTGTVGGTASVDIRSDRQASCKGTVTGLVAGGRPYMPTA